MAASLTIFDAPMMRSIMPIVRFRATASTQAAKGTAPTTRKTRVSPRTSGEAAGGRKRMFEVYFLEPSTYCTSKFSSKFGSMARVHNDAYQ